jgi:hypothetical protein
VAPPEEVFEPLKTGIIGIAVRKQTAREADLLKNDTNSITYYNLSGGVSRRRVEQQTFICIRLLQKNAVGFEMNTIFILI